MEADKETNPSPIKSLLNKSFNSIDLIKKRKLEAEPLGLPVPKHQCWNRSLSSKPATFDSSLELEGFSPCTFKGKGGAVFDVSGTGSAKGSNSIAEYSDSAISVHAEAASSSSSDWGSSSKGSRYSPDSTTVSSRGVKKEVLSSPVGEPEPADVELAENLESLVDYGSYMDHIYSGYGNYTVEQYQDKEIEEILKSEGANPNVYVLSSGRWSVNQEASRTTRKPTIDQEFEQYFSMLML